MRKQHDLTIYVACNGRDTWSGRMADPQPDLSDGPVATLRCACERARDARISGKTARVLLRGGVYELDAPLTLTAADSGTVEAPAIFAAYPGEAPVLSGGRHISGWQVDAVHGNPCWVVDLPEVRAGQWNFTQLFVNGERRFRPRLPKTGFYRFTDVPPASPGALWYHGPTVVGFEAGHIQDWCNRDDIKVMALELWFESHHRIRSVDEAQHRVEFRCKSIGRLRDERQLPARYFVENVFEALTEPGEFYLDRTAGRLYYRPRPGEDPATAEVVAPRESELLVLAGTEAAPVRHVRFENIAFQHAEWDYAPDDVGSVQAAWKVPGAVVLEWAEDCVFYGCEVAHVAQYGLEVRTGSAGNRVIACALFDLGGGGVRIGHEWMERSDDTAATLRRSRPDGRRMATTVSDCEIHHGSLIHYQAVSVWVGNSGGNRILHNHIHDMNYTGISCGWTWGYSDTAAVDNRIEFNHIHHINWDRLLSDNGGIYTLGRQPGTTLRGNVIHQVGCYGYGGWGIYLDEGSSGLRIEDNLVYETDDAGFFTHYGRDNLVRNNIFALSSRHHINPATRPESHRSTLFERNLVYWENGGFQDTECLWMPGHYLCRDNVFWNGRGGDPDLGRGVRLSEWRAIGQHAGTVVDDPLFLNPQAGDFTLRADTPATSVGFKPFDARRAGPRLRKVRPVTVDAWPPEKLDEGRPIVHTVMEETDSGGIRITLHNLGQCPARGRLRLRCTPAGALVFGGSPRLDFSDLQPGASRSAEFAVLRRRPLHFATVESVVSGEGLVPVLLFCKSRLEWTISRLPPIATADAVALKLARSKTQPILWARAVRVGLLRMAVAGSDLALWLRLEDPSPSRGTPLSAGSCIEFFVASSGDQVASTAKLRQVFLAPAVGGQADRLFIQDGGRQIEDPRLRMTTRPTSDGYEMAALLPLDLLGIAPAERELYIELAARVMRLPSEIPRRASLFEALSAWNSNAGYGRVTIEKEGN